MFESTLEAQGLHAGSKSGSALTAAVALHLAVAAVIVTASALVIVPPPTPDIPPTIWIPQVIPDPGERRPHLPEPPRPPKGGGGRAGGQIAPPLLPAPLVPPRVTPPDLPAPAETGETGAAPGLSADRPGWGADTGPGAGGDGSSGAAEPLFVTSDVTSPVLLKRVEPAYPETARIARLPGRVVLQAVIGTDGSVESVEVLSSSNPLFEAAALGAVRQWRYRPALMGGRAVRVYFTISVSFVLR